MNVSVVPSLKHYWIQNNGHLVNWSLWPLLESGRRLNAMTVSTHWVSIGHPDCSAAMQLHTQHSMMHCVFWHLSIRTSSNFFSNLTYSSSSVGSNHRGYSLLPTCITTIQLLVHHCSFHGPLLREHTSKTWLFWHETDQMLIQWTKL